MEILPRFFEENSYGLLTNSDIESLYYTTTLTSSSSSLGQSTKQPMSTPRKTSESNLLNPIKNSENNEIDCTVHIEVEQTKKVNQNKTFYF